MQQHNKDFHKTVTAEATKIYWVFKNFDKNGEGFASIKAKNWLVGHWPPQAAPVLPALQN